MSLATRAGDLVYTFRFLKILVTKFEDTDAFKMGIIDNEGKRNKDVPVKSDKEKSAYTPFHKLVFNIKKLIAKAPGGSSRLASYASALFLIKEHYAVSEKNLHKILKESNLEIVDLLNEQHQWFVLDNNQIAPGIYRLKNDKVLSDSLDDIVYAKDKIKINENAFPIDDVFGINIYEAVHVNTGKRIHITVGEVDK